MLPRPTLSKSAVSFSPFVSLLVALVELAIASLSLFYANLSLFYCSGNQHLAFQQAIAHFSLFYCSGNQHLTLQQAIAHSTSFYLSPGQLPTTKRTIANFNLFSFSTKRAIAGLIFLCLPTSPKFVLEQASAAVLGQGYLFKFLSLCAAGRQVF